jgi:hypothetical protein
MVLMSPSASLECVQGRVQPRDEDPIKRVEHPFPQSTSPKNVFPKVFQMKKKNEKKKKKRIFGFDVWLACRVERPSLRCILLPKKRFPQKQLDVWF